MAVGETRGLNSYHSPTRDPDADTAGENGGGSERQEKTGEWCIGGSIIKGTEKN